jgi:hypothetical protein
MSQCGLQAGCRMPPAPPEVTTLCWSSSCCVFEIRKHRSQLRASALPDRGSPMQIFMPSSTRQKTNGRNASGLLNSAGELSCNCVWQQRGASNSADAAETRNQVGCVNRHRPPAEVPEIRIPCRCRMTGDEAIPRNRSGCIVTNLFEPARHRHPGAGQRIPRCSGWFRNQQAGGRVGAQIMGMPGQRRNQDDRTA